MTLEGEQGLLLSPEGWRTLDKLNWLAMDEVPLSVIGCIITWLQYNDAKQSLGWSNTDHPHQKHTQLYPLPRGVYGGLCWRCGVEIKKHVVVLYQNYDVVHFCTDRKRQCGLRVMQEAVLDPTCLEDNHSLITKGGGGGGGTGKSASMTYPNIKLPRSTKRYRVPEIPESSVRDSGYFSA